MKIKQIKWGITILSLSILPGYISAALAESPSPLDADQHPGSPPYESLFPDQVISLDTDLSWTRRFLGNESFNKNESLPSTSPVIEQSSIYSDDDELKKREGKLDKFDTSGVVKQVRLSEGKVKIEHGPIDRLGMPAMTMMFRVSDPEQLMNIDKGTEIDFSVDNTAAGFTITNLELSAVNFDTTGVVKQVKSPEGKVKIKHGPIERLGMPAMTMLFRTEDVKQLNGLEKGSEVAFNIENTAAGFTITKIETLSDDVIKKFDASGTVKSVRLSQGKVKIEHGPIDHLGMPAMTMLFKVKNPDDLSVLVKDMPVEFNVESNASGFEITLIRPTQKTNSSASSEKVNE